MKIPANILIALFVFSGMAHASTQTLICKTGELFDMNVEIESNSGKEKISVILNGMKNSDQRVYTNSNYEDSAISRFLSKGRFVGVVSTSDITKVLFNVYIDAGIIDILFDQVAKKYYVDFAAEGKVYHGECK